MRLSGNLREKLEFVFIQWWDYGWRISRDYTGILVPITSSSFFFSFFAFLQSLRIKHLQRKRFHLRRWQSDGLFSRTLSPSLSLSMKSVETLVRYLHVPAAARLLKLQTSNPPALAETTLVLRLKWVFWKFLRPFGGGCFFGRPCWETDVGCRPSSQSHWLSCSGS